MLESRPADVEGQIEALIRGFDGADGRRDDGLEGAVAADQVCFGKAILQISDERIGIIAEKDRCDALAAGGDKD